MAKYLIVNADDFGLSHGVNRGIIECFERGIVTSASLMVRQPAAVGAAAYARQHPQLSVGLHLDLGEWLFKDGEWQPRYQVVDLQNETAITCEIERQLEEFRRLMGRNPTHLDSHQHVHRREPSRRAAAALAQSLGIVLRGNHPLVHYCGHFYGQDTDEATRPDAITVAALERILSDLPEGVTELGCHPGHLEGLDSAYQVERKTEILTLCDPVMAASLRTLNIKLCSFADLPDLHLI